MIKIHHLNNSRSHRVLWLLEELNAEYEIIKYQRDKFTNLAPKELKDIHSLGKSPVLEHNGKMIIESAQMLSTVHRMLDGKMERRPSKSGSMSVSLMCQMTNFRTSLTVH